MKGSLVSLSKVDKFPNFDKGQRKGINLSLSCVKTQAIISLYYGKFRLDNEDELAAY